MKTDNKIDLSERTKGEDIIKKVFSRDADFDRFWNKVAVTANTNKCWEWNGTKDSFGYGLFGARLQPNKWQNFSAHRISFAYHNQSQIMPQCVCHSCDNPKCVNPNHLWAGNNQLNIQDAIKKGRFKGFENIGFGQFHASAKLTVIDVIAIVRMNELGMRNCDIASYFKVSTANISKICKGNGRTKEFENIVSALNNLQTKYNQQ